MGSLTHQGKGRFGGLNPQPKFANCLLFTNGVAPINDSAFYELLWSLLSVVTPFKLKFHPFSFLYLMILKRIHSRAQIVWSITCKLIFCSFCILTRQRHCDHSDLMLEHSELCRIDRNKQIASTWFPNNWANYKSMHIILHCYTYAF